MSAVLTPMPSGQAQQLASDSVTITWRNLSKLKRSPDMIIFAVLQPIMFVLLFTQVYGGAIDVPGSNYTDFLMAGIFAQTVVFGSTFSGSSMAQDLKEGIIDRFRTLPMSPTAVLIGRTCSDLLLNSISVVVMVSVGFAVGWRFHNGVPAFLLGIAILLMFSYAFSWVMALIGMSVKSPETINNVSFMVLFPLTFISNAFVPASTLPAVLQFIANWNPVSALVQAARAQFGNLGAEPIADTFTMQNPLLSVVGAAVLMLVIFVPLATWKFANISSR